MEVEAGKEEKLKAEEDSTIGEADILEAERQIGEAELQIEEAERQCVKAERRHDNAKVVATSPRISLTKLKKSPKTGRKSSNITPAMGGTTLRAWREININREVL